jgi:translation initiation factor IF-2
MVEGKGGHVPTIEISAKTGKGIEELLETILIISSDLNLKYQETDPPRA